jgi:hypothetical protein
VLQAWEVLAMTYSRTVVHDSLCTVHRVPNISGKENSSQNWKILLLSDHCAPMFPLWQSCCVRINCPKSLGTGKSDFKFFERQVKQIIVHTLFKKE